MAVFKAAIEMIEIEWADFVIDFAFDQIRQNHFEQIADYFVVKLLIDFSVG